jgi:hypothetical protein
MIFTGAMTHFYYVTISQQENCLDSLYTSLYANFLDVLSEAVNIVASSQGQVEQFTFSYVAR